MNIEDLESILFSFADTTQRLIVALQKNKGNTKKRKIISLQKSKKDALDLLKTCNIHIEFIIRKHYSDENGEDVVKELVRNYCFGDRHFARLTITVQDNDGVFVPGTIRVRLVPNVNQPEKKLKRRRVKDGRILTPKENRRFMRDIGLKYPKE